MAKKETEIEVTIKVDGTIDIEQLGWEGKDCAHAIDDLLKKMGPVEKTTKKKAYFRPAVNTKQSQKRKT